VSLPKVNFSGMLLWKREGLMRGFYHVRTRRDHNLDFSTYEKYAI
jgi:hypothetical protein